MSEKWNIKIVRLLSGATDVIAKVKYRNKSVIVGNINDGNAVNNLPLWALFYRLNATAISSSSIIRFCYYSLFTHALFINEASNSYCDAELL